MKAMANMKYGPPDVLEVTGVDKPIPNDDKVQQTDRHDLQYDVVVVGGGSAGLSAALVLGRSRRRTLVLDSGEPRNAPSSGVHGFFSRDGIPPEELLRIGREQLEPYPSVEVRSARVTGATKNRGGTMPTGRKQQPEPPSQCRRGSGQRRGPRVVSVM